jgi:hypothetical protein
MLKINSVTTENAVPVPTAPKASSFKRYGKIIVPVIVAVLIVILAVAFFIPKGSATIPLTVNYVVGEKMAYDTTMTMQLNLGQPGTPIATYNDYLNQPITVNGQETIEVLSDDGDYYTLLHTMNYDSILGSAIPITMTEKMYKTGYSTYFMNIGDTEISLPSNQVGSTSYLAQLLSQPEAKIGETITVPYPDMGLTGFTSTGNLKITFSAPEDKTFAGQTFNAFKIEMVSDGVSINVELPTTIPSASTEPVTVAVNLHYVIYLENGSMRMLQSSMQADESLQSSGYSMAVSVTMDSTLTQDTKP